MVRTVVHPSKARAPVAPEGAQVQQPPDTFGDKLVKYIPAEVIAFFLPAFALARALKLEWVDWLVLALAAFGLVGYLLIKADKTHPPRPYFYLLSLVAFFAWAAGTSSAGEDLFCFSQPDITGKLIVMGAVFLVPLVDELLTRYLP